MLPHTLRRKSVQYTIKTRKTRKSLLGQVLLLLALVAVVVVLAPPELPPQALDRGELEVEDGVEKGLAVLAIDAAKGVDVLEGAVVRQARDRPDHDLRELGYGAAGLAEELVVLGRRGVGPHAVGAVVRLAAVGVVGGLVLLVDKLDALVRLGAGLDRLPGRAVLVQHDQLGGRLDADAVVVVLGVAPGTM